MIGQFGNPQFSNTNFASGSPKPRVSIIGKLIAVIGDTSSHGGVLIDSNQDGKAVLKTIAMCVNGCHHSCPIPGHGVTTVTAITTRTFINGKLIVGYGAVAGCGAIITPKNRKATAE